MVPLSLQRGKRAACFPFAELLNSYLYTREHSASPLVKQHVLHRLENPSGFLPTCEALQGFTPTREWHSHSYGQRTCRSQLLLISRSINSQPCLVHPCNSPDNKKRQRNFLPLFDIWRETLPMCDLKSDSLMSVFCMFTIYLVTRTLNSQTCS